MITKWREGREMEVFVLRGFFSLRCGKKTSAKAKNGVEGGRGVGRTKAAAPLRVVRATRSGKGRKTEGRQKQRDEEEELEVGGTY